MDDLKNMAGKDFLRWLAKQFIVDQPLEPDSPLYQPIYENHPADPIELPLTSATWPCCSWTRTG